MEPEGDAAEEGSMAWKFADYKKKLAQWTKENEYSDDEVKELDIKTRIRENKKENKIDQELLSEAVRWRLSQNDC